jgi:hypothetical protein
MVRQWVHPPHLPYRHCPAPQRPFPPVVYARGNWNRKLDGFAGSDGEVDLPLKRVSALLGHIPKFIY